ncbi:17821_t:CDS:2, partial [Racocetra persica]
KLIRAKESDEMDKIRKEVREVKKGIKNDLKRREIKYENEKLEKIFSVCEEVVGTQVSLDQIQAYFEEEAESKFKKIVEAYTVLYNPSKRKRYDNSEGSFCYADSDFHAAYNTAYEEFAELIERALKETRGALKEVRQDLE